MNDERGLTITRVFDAPREQFFKAFTEPERFAKWFGAPTSEVPPSSVSMDVRPGGAWRATMVVQESGQEIHWKGEFREVVEPERLVFTITDQTGGEDEYEVCTVVLTDVGGKTEMQFEQRGGHLDESGYERAKQGWDGFFDAMEEQLG
jgi:uncharacterized protein YndB with AHSA1/START domain